MEQVLKRLTGVVSAKTGVPITQSTARNYIRYVTNLHLKVFPSTEMRNLNWLKNWSQVEPALESYADSTQVSVLNAICALLRVTPRMKTLLKHYETELKKRVHLNRAVPTEDKTETQKDYWMNWEDILKMRDNLPQGLDKVLVSLYTMWPPGRAQEYATMQINEGDNQYNPSTGVMRIRKHKTSREFPDEVSTVPAELKAVLSSWLAGRTSGSVLGLPSAGAITKRLNKVFAPKKISVSALRHIYDTHYHGESIKALKADAKLMRHSVGTAMRTYIKSI